MNSIRGKITKREESNLEWII